MSHVACRILQVLMAAGRMSGLAILAKTGANQDDLSSAKGSRLSTGKKKRVGVAAGTSAAVSGSPAKGGSKSLSKGRSLKDLFRNKI